MNNKHMLSHFWNLLRLEKREIEATYFYAILGGLLNLSLPLGIQAIIGFVLGASMVTSIYVLIFIVIIGVLLIGMMQINQMRIAEKIQQKIFTRNAFAFAEKIPNIDLQKADNYHIAEKTNRFFETVSIQKSITKILLDIPLATIQILFGLILLSFYHAMFIAFGFILIAILWVILKFSTKKGIETSFQESNKKYELVEWLVEMARTIKSFKLSQGSHLNLKKTDTIVTGYLKARTQHFRILEFQYMTLVVFKVTITSMMLIIGVYLLINQKLNIGEFIAAEIVIISVINAVEKLISNIDSIYDMITGLEKLDNVLSIASEQSGEYEMPANKPVSVQMQDLTFTYLDGLKALTHITFQIPAGSKVCITGDADSGKSTLLKVLTGTFTQFEGMYLINNIPINNYKMETLRNNMGVLFHYQDLFKGTLFENISLSRSGVSSEKIIELSKHLGVSGYLNQSVSSFDALIDSSGKKLSSTIIKKILLLRTFINNPTLICLEEPWLGLLSDEKEQIVNYIFHQIPNATVFVICNDDPFIQLCDYQIHLHKGKATCTKIK